MKGLFLISIVLFLFMSSEAKNKEKATLGAGCFWCVEAIYDQLEGVISVESGYSGGHEASPTYKEVCTGSTGHAEVCQITYDADVISFGELLTVFWSVHDPTTLNRQGADVGTQYRSAIFYHNQEQKRIAEEQIKVVNAQKLYDDPIVTEVTAFTKFYQAEDYHQEYFANNPNQGYCRMVVGPKVEKFQKLFKDQLKK
ncbi:MULTISPECIES: peptide-methionine (S)-S-oxide reductase MsrA [unclassified Saccharicrinis]|uniref:peptide-methionine (S)-S-oxide reductase MsrA n=1 Tax=unclassified Saccharicrinis TaxID=2646859 RepID=UPI003D34F88F